MDLERLETLLRTRKPGLMDAAGRYAVLVPLVDLFARPFRPAHVEDMFAAYREHRTVDITDNLGK